ncbi:hypothetical protein SAMN04487897_12086 [Paenibacillus sp. yr247]|uniref:hypothetical protein n=1 Tax=Paenibacillus sp. yr247 TaxID=1761880 RepID=UPI00088E754C|nr:hypothetical protein [Paenibacillus sp. yr247]SDO72899.1 hypothetical protein SAMN04487897_12086 [Paenibacillus sp. yr247]
MTTVTGGVYTADIDAYLDMDLSITDNAAEGPLGTVTVDTEGMVHVIGNVSSFELTAVTSTGQKVTSYVKLTR